MDRADPLQVPVYLSPKDFASLTGMTDLSPVQLNEDNTFEESLTSLEKRKPFAKANDVIKSNEAIELEQLFSGNEPNVKPRLPLVAEQELAMRLLAILSSVKGGVDSNNSRQPPSGIMRLDSSGEEDDFDLVLPGNIYSNSKFERQERLDVKKPGPWFSVNNFAFTSNGGKVENPHPGIVSKDVAEGESNNISQINGDEQIEEPQRYDRTIPENEKFVGSPRQQLLPSLIDQDYVFDLVEDVPTFRDFRKNDYLSLVSKSGGLQKSNVLAIGQLFDEMSLDEQDDKILHNDDILAIDSAQTSSIEKPSSKTTRSSWKEEESEIPTKFHSNKNVPSPSSIPRDHEIVEANYAFVTVKEGFQSWEQGAGLVNVLSDLLQVPRDTFTDIGVRKNQVTFRVMPNEKGLNPSSVAAKTDEVGLRDQIRRLTGLQVDATGIGDQTQISSILYWGQENQQMLLTAGLCLLAGAILVASVIIFLLRNRYIARQKLKDLTQSVDTEATRDYQDLCRARMATKSNSTEACGSKGPHAFLSRDSESSRSSTSSWCEEPVLTNMDISTGHMVLSYMEDHLRNKDRLDQEWQALCAYEAEPSTSVRIASQVENKNKNRYEDVLPYDHSRVVLNALSNVTGSDYINASSITDHDPRHPAYIAAQAPVEDSTSDFWQMVWEQGSVVLVLLTRLQENGQTLCHNYWPEEGSQLYHIYEVHLVSEHIWCDDYLVRSFYLKNIRSGETRTVTQFHFQSWPENGVPSSTKSLLEFRRKVNKSYRGRSCPIVVHCSDGAGRSGTYCLIDMVLHRMAKGAREIDIAATLEHLRDQRSQAVRSKQQFEFVLTAVAEEVHAILRALPQ